MNNPKAEACPYCGQANWQLSEAQLGRLGHNVTIWAQVTECKVCGYHFMTDEQVDQADQDLVAIENTYHSRYHESH